MKVERIAGRIATGEPCWSSAFYRVVRVGHDKWSLRSVEDESEFKWFGTRGEAEDVATRESHHAFRERYAPVPVTLPAPPSAAVGGCPWCEATDVCGRAHLYVIELAATFDAENAGSRPGSGRPAVYVGYTGHRPECRFQQHVAYARGDNGFDCACFGALEPRGFIGRPLPPGAKPARTKGVAEAGRHAVHLLPELYAHLNPRGPAGRDESKEDGSELALATALHDAPYRYNVLTDASYVKTLRARP